MYKYLFYLGHQPHISTAEILAVFSAKEIKYEVEANQKDKKVLVLSTEESIESEKLIIQLGGTIKITKEVEKYDSVKETIINHLENVQSIGKIQFALTGLNNKRIALEVKKILKSNGRSVRYVEIKNTASILHNNLVKKQGDLTISGSNIYVTEAIQPIFDLAERDFKRPGTDSKSGMLPPKLARIMINLAKQKNTAGILDPFCGSGTILMEAAYMGFTNLIGTDTSKKALHDTRINIEWIKEKEDAKNLKYKIISSDSTKVDAEIIEESIDAIISEPYMGKPLRGNESELFLKKQTYELSDLFVNSFKSFKEILVYGGVAIFIIPSFRYKDDWVKIDCIEKIKQLGFEVIPFSEEHKFLRYWRTDQHLARDIWQFRKKG